MTDFRDEIMAETGGPVLCYRATRAVSDELYSDYIHRVQEAVKAYGEFRLLIHYQDFPGWDAVAAEKDVGFYSQYGRYMKKLALVNPPDKEVMAKLLRKDIIGGAIRIFSGDRLGEAIDWVRS